MESSCTMTTASNIAPSSKHSTTSGILARGAQIGISLVIEVAILFGAAGRLDWTWAWLFLGLYVLAVAINASLMLRRSPEMIAEGGQAAITRTWDKIVSGLWALAQYLLLPLVAGLDARLFWSGELALGWHIAGALLFALGMAFFSWAMVTNAYFSTAVRIQSERGHTVCTTGPYHFVRHPGYSGTLLQSVGAALLLGSWWALIPALVAMGAIIARTALEDRTLQAELPGYAEYAQSVRYRLVPAVW